MWSVANEMRKTVLGGDCMIPVCWDEISPLPAWIDRTIQLQIKLQTWRPAKRLQHRRFPANIAKFLWISFLKNTFGGCFSKMMNFYKGICQLFFLIDWRHICLKNTIEIFSVYWNVLLWIFFNWLCFSSRLGELERMLWENFVPAKRYTGSTKDRSHHAGMKLFTCNRRM